MRVITEATQEPIALQNDEVQVIYPQPQVDLVQQVQHIPGVSQYPGPRPDLGALRPQPAQPESWPTRRCARRSSRRSNRAGHHRQDRRPVQRRGHAAEQPHVRAAAGGLQGLHRRPEQGTGDVERAPSKILTDAGYTSVGEGQQLTTPNGQRGAAAADPLHRRATRSGRATCELVRAQVQAARHQRRDRADRRPRRHHRQRRLRHHRLRLGADAVPVRQRRADVEQSTSASNYGGVQQPRGRPAASTRRPRRPTRQRRRDKLNEADRILAEDAYVLPLYQKPTFIAVQDKVGERPEQLVARRPDVQHRRVGPARGRLIPLRGRPLSQQPPPEPRSLPSDLGGRHERPPYRPAGRPPCSPSPCGGSRSRSRSC